jgi:hypothetical protein
LSSQKFGLFFTLFCAIYTNRAGLSTLHNFFLLFNKILFILLFLEKGLIFIEKYAIISLWGTSKTPREKERGKKRC